MLNISGSRITLTRGDSAVLNLTIYTPDGSSIYELQTGDTVVFSLGTDKECIKKNKILIQKTFADNQIKIDPIDTKYLNCQTYVYDIQLNFSDGEINTIIPYSDFVLAPEVT